MKKLYVLLSLLSLLVITGCKKIDKNTNSVENVDIHQDRLELIEEITYIDFTITNNSNEEKYIKKIRISYIKDENENEMYAIFDDILKPNENKQLSASIEDDLTNIDNIKYEAMKE